MTREKVAAAADWRQEAGRFLSAPGRLALLGVGLRQRGDDGIGSFVAADLAKMLPAGRRREVLILDAGGAPEQGTGRLRRFGPDRLLIVDAAASGRRPGEIALLAPEAIAAGEPSTHRPPLSLLLRYIRETIPCRLLILGIEPHCFDRPRLSLPLQRSRREIVRFILPFLS